MRPARRLLGALGLGAALLAGCDAEPPAPPLERLRPEPAPGGEPPPPRTVLARWDLLEERERWTLEAPVKRFVESGEELPPGSPPMLVVAAGRREREIRLTRQARFDPVGVDRVQVWLVAHGGGGLGLALDLWRDGAVVHSLPGGALHTLDTLVRVDVELPPALRVAEPFDAVSLRLLGGYRRFALRDVVLVSEPPAARLPDAAQPPELVVVGGDARPAVGLLEGRPLELRVRGRRHGRLRLHHAWPAALGAPPPAGARLRAELSGADGPLVVERPVGERPDAWLALELPLPAGDGVHTLRLELLRGADDGAAPAAGGARARLACLVTTATAWTPAPSPPTTVLITSDTHRADHVGYRADGVPLATPVLDALAARGSVYLDAWTSVNNTNPSHVALLTGTSPRDTRVLSNYDGVGPAARTLAEAFAEQGWSTVAALSTRHLGPPGSGLGQGFDRVSWPVDVAQRDSTETLAALTGWLDELADRPLFVWLHVFDAHTPYEPPADVAARHWDPARDPFDPSLPAPEVPARVLPPELAGLRELEWARAMYRAEVEAQDARLRALLEHPRLAGAHVAFVADHGELLGEHGVYFNHVGAYPGTLHVPLVLAGPRVPRGALVRAPVSHLDVGRTLLDLSGLEQVPFPGRVLPRAGETARVEPRFAVEAFGASATVQQGELFLVLSLMERDLPNVLASHAKHQVELYDLARDPRAEHDLVDERPQDAARLRGLLVRWLEQRQDLGWRDAGTADAEQLAELRALGYVAPEGAVEADALWQPDDCAWCRRFDEGG